MKLFDQEKRLRELEEKYYENGRWVELWEKIRKMESDIHFLNMSTQKLNSKLLAVVEHVECKFELIGEDEQVRHRLVKNDEANK